MLRRISTKLVLAVLAAVVVPFAAYAVFLDRAVGDDLKREVVLYSLKGLAADLSQRVDRKVEERDLDVLLWSQSPVAARAVDELDRELSGGRRERVFRDGQAENFDAAVVHKRVYDLLLLVNAGGRLVVSNRVQADGRPLAPDVLAALAARDFAREPWFARALGDEYVRLDKHVTDLLPPRRPGEPRHPENAQIGFAAPVHRLLRADGRGPEVSGVLLGLVNWSHFQAEVDQAVLKEYFRGLVGPEEFPSAYGWIWGADADTILAHPLLALHGERVSGPVVGPLPQLVEAARSDDWGNYPEYTFKGKKKNGAYRHCASPEEGGFGWVVGVGIDNDDIFFRVKALREVLYKGTLAVVLVIVLWTMVVARRTTSPIVALKAHAEQVAAGDLAARTSVRSDDELGDLARTFNEMTTQLAESREQLVKAEKDAAWREMARQVAHDIKNPLTPIKLSADLLRRAHREGSPDFERIFERTLDTISRQVEHLRAIASDFHALTGVYRHDPKVFDAGGMVDEVLGLQAAWAEELGVCVRREGGGGVVRVDPDQLRRVLNNLVSNAFEAMPDGGQLVVRVSEGVTARGPRLTIEVRDTGHGVSEEARPHLFEPYFTTRSTGTGLGLAIARRVVEEMGGEIELVAAPQDDGLGHGTVARVRLPLHDGPAPAGDGARGGAP